MPEYNLIVEIDGISHYKGSINKENAKTRVKREVLKKLGYKYTNIDLMKVLGKSDNQLQVDIISRLIEESIN